MCKTKSITNAYLVFWIRHSKNIVLCMTVSTFTSWAMIIINTFQALETKTWYTCGATITGHPFMAIKTCKMRNTEFVLANINTRAIQKVKKVYAYSPRTCFVAANHWFLVFSVLKNCLISRILSCCKCRDSCGHGCAKVWGVISFLQANEFLGYLAKERSSRVELFCCTTMHVHILPGRHKPCCISNFIGTSSSILHIVQTWHHQTFPCFQKRRNTLLVNNSQMMKTWRMLSATTWYEEGTSALMSKTIMWNSR